MPYLIGIAIILALLLLAFLPLHIGIAYSYDDKDTWIRVRIGWLFKKIKLGGQNQQKKEKRNKKDIKKDKSDDDNIIEKLQDYYSIWQDIEKEVTKVLEYCKRHIKIDIFHIKTDFGFSDAATTGIVAGLAYAVCYTILGAIYNSVGIYDLKININPCFTDEQKRVYLNCGLKTSIAHLVRVAYMVVRLIKFK